MLGPPEPPEFINDDTEATGRNVTVTWKNHADNNCAITMYTLHYRIVGPTIKDKTWSSVNISDKTFTRYKLQLQYSKKYELIVSAWNKLGHSNSTAWHLSTAQGNVSKLTSKIFKIRRCELYDNAIGTKTKWLRRN